MIFVKLYIYNVSERESQFIIGLVFVGFIVFADIPDDLLEALRAFVQGSEGLPLGELVEDNVETVGVKDELFGGVGRWWVDGVQAEAQGVVHHRWDEF